MTLLNVDTMQNQQGAFLIFSVILCNAKRLFLQKKKKERLQVKDKHQHIGENDLTKYLCPPHLLTSKIATSFTIIKIKKYSIVLENKKTKN